MEQATQEIELKFLEELQGDNPKIMGFDYYGVIYCATALLALAMGMVYFTAEDDAVKNMVLVHGALSIGLMLAVMWYRSKLHK